MRAIMYITGVITPELLLPSPSAAPKLMILQACKPTDPQKLRTIHEGTDSRLFTVQFLRILQA